jgi:hypothetical protein
MTVTMFFLGRNPGYEILKHDFELSSVERPNGKKLPGDSPDAYLPDGGLLSELKLAVGTT